MTTIDPRRRNQEKPARKKGSDDAMGAAAERVLDRVRVQPGKKFRLRDHDPAWVGGGEFAQLGRDALKDRAKSLLAGNVEALSRAQELLYASDVWSVLLVFQAMDAAGKDGTIKHVMSGVNPQGCQVFSFKRPSEEDIDHDFLWRYVRGLPERGRIGIFNRSYYEEVLVVRVHRSILDAQRLPPGKRGRGFWEDRYEDINVFERHLHRNGTLILKFFLNVSRDEQKRRFLERLDNEEKNWKFSAADIAERGYWDQYMEAYEDMIRATSTRWAPWHVIPADHKFVARAMVAGIVTKAIRSLDLEYPQLDEEEKAALERARANLMAEP